MMLFECCLSLIGMRNVTEQWNSSLCLVLLLSHPVYISIGAEIKNEKPGEEKNMSAL